MADWAGYEAWKRNRSKKEEEDKEEEDRVRGTLSSWDLYEYDKLVGNWSGASGASASEEEKKEPDRVSLYERLTGISAGAPSESKTVEEKPDTLKGSMFQRLTEKEDPVEAERKNGRNAFGSLSSDEVRREMNGKSGADPRMAAAVANYTAGMAAERAKEEAVPEALRGRDYSDIGAAWDRVRSGGRTTPGTNEGGTEEPSMPTSFTEARENWKAARQTLQNAKAAIEEKGNSRQGRKNREEALGDVLDQRTELLNELFPIQESLKIVDDVDQRARAAELEKQIAELDKEIDAWDQNAIGLTIDSFKAEENAKKAEEWYYTMIPTAEDFEKNSTFAPSGAKDFDAGSVNGTRVYNIPDRVNGYLKAGDSDVLAWYWYDYIDQMSDMQRKTYNYILNTEGREDADAYLEWLKPELEKSATEAMEGQAQEFGKEHPLAAAGLTVLGAGFKGAGNLAALSDRYLYNKPVDVYAPYNRLNAVHGAAREGLTERASEDVTDLLDRMGASDKVKETASNVVTFLTGTGLSMLDSSWNALLAANMASSLCGMDMGQANQIINTAKASPYVVSADALAQAERTVELGEFLGRIGMASNVMTDAVKDAKARGLSDDAALGEGLLAIAWEYATEKYSIENLFESDWTESGLKKIMKQGAFEGSEELASGLGNLFTDILLASDKSEWKQAVRAYEDNGMSKRDAFRAAFIDKAGELGIDFLGGFLSGFGMGGEAYLSAWSYNRAIGAVGTAQKNADRSADIEAARAAERARRLKEKMKAAGASTDETPAEGIELPTGAEAAEAETSGEARFGTEPAVKTLTPTAEEAEINDAVAKAEAEGNLTRATGIRQGVDEKTIRKAERYAKRTGRNVEFFTEDAKNGAVKNGFYDPETNTIWLNSKAKKGTEFTVGHEFTHGLEGTEAYDALMDRAKTRSAEQGEDWIAKREKMKALYERATGKVQSDEYYDQEILADWIGENLSDERTIREICREEASVAKKLRDVLDRFVIDMADAKGVYTDYEVRKIKNVIGLIDKYVGRANENPERAAQDAREASLAGETLPAGENTSGVQIVGQAQPVDAATGETAAEYLARMQTLLDEGEITEEEYGAAEDLAAEMESTGRGIEATTVEEEEAEGKISRAVKRLVGRRASYTEADTSMLSKPHAKRKRLTIASAWTSKNGDLQSSDANAPRLYVQNESATSPSPIVSQPGVDVKGEERLSLSPKEAQNYEGREAVPAAETEDGEVLTETLRGGSEIRYSYTSWNDTDKMTVMNNLMDAGFTQRQAKRYIDNVNSIAAIIGGDRDRLDYDAADNQVFMKPNAEYVVTLDASTLCAKRLTYQGTFNKIQHALGNRVMMPEDLIDLANMMAEDGYKTPCGICYVESRRRHLGKFASEWLDSYKGEYVPALDEVTTTDGLERLRQEHPDTYQDFIDAMNKKGTNNPKVVQLRTDYRGDINKLTKGKIEKIIRIGGVRVQSFSDFETPHLIDMMQAILDMSAKKLPAQAYTKVPNFAWAFGDTGIKINLSLIGGIDENGNLTFSSTEGMDFNEAMRVRDRYSENVGTILVGMNDAHILAAMADPRIDYIIPFHKSGWSTEELEKMKTLRGFEDYTNQQNERRITGRKKNGGYETEAIKDGNLYPEDYWDYNVSGRENAERYLKLCAEQNRLPKFWKFLVDNGDGTFSLQPDGSTDGYWKTLIDYKMYDNDGNGAPQRAVTPDFNMEECQRILSEYEGGANELPSASEEFIDKYVRHYEEVHGEGEKRFSISAAEDADYMEAVEAGDTETAQRMVDEAARAAGAMTLPNGRRKPYYHGTTAKFTVFDINKSQNGTYGYGFYFSPMRSKAEGYGDVNPYYIMTDRIATRDDHRITPEQVLQIRQEYGLTAGDDALEKLGSWITNSDDMSIMLSLERSLERNTDAAPEDYLQRFREVFGYDGLRQTNETVLWDNRLVKSADPVTYDDEGNVIPLSERFNDTKADIRWSMSEAGDEEGMTQKAKGKAMQIERQFASDVLQAIQRNVNPQSAEFRQFRQDVARPVIEAMLRGEAADEDAILETTGIDIVGQAAARGAVRDAIRQAKGKIEYVAGAVRESRQRQEQREARKAEIAARIPEDAGGLIELANKVKDARKRFASLKARTIMSEEDLELAHKIATGQISEGEAFAQNAMGMDAITNMAQAEKEMLDAAAPWEMYTKRLSKERRDEADKLLANAAAAKDKEIGFAYDRETPMRNFRDVFGSDAEAMIDKYIRPISKAGAAATKFQKEYNKRVNDLGLSRKVKYENTMSESAAVQFLGEAEDNIRVLELARGYNAVRDGKTLEEWKAAIEAFRNENPNLDYGKIRKGIEEFQKIYNELITRMNEVLVENGYMPVNVRRGYFPHFMGGNDGILATFAHMLGIDIQANGLPTSINGLTRLFKPGKPWFSHALERTGFATDYDALQGFDGYLKGVSDVIHYTPAIRNLRTLGTQIRYKFGNEGIKKQINEIEADENLSENAKLAAISDLNEKGRYKLSNFVAWLDEYTNQLANKTPLADREFENKIGRKWYNRLKGLEGRVAANMIVGNFGSALTNFIPLNQAAAILDQKPGDFYMLRGMFDTMTGRAKSDGFVDRSDFLTNRRGVDPLIRGWTDNIADFLSKPMNVIDNFTSEAIVRAAYNKYLKQGLDEQSAMQAADEFAAGVMADRSKGALPTIFGSRNPLTKLFTQFQVEVNNEFSVLFKDISKGAYRTDKDKKQAVAAVAWTLLRYFLGAYFFNDLYEKMVGRRSALDPVDVLNDAVGDFSGKKLNNLFDMLTDGAVETVWEDEEDKPNPYKVTENIVKNIGEELPFVGGAIFGGGRIPAGSAIPKLEKLNQATFDSDWAPEKKAETIWREIGGSALTYLAPPFGGGLIKKLVQTGTNLYNGGRTIKNKEGKDQLQYPYYTEASDRDRENTERVLSLFGLEEYAPQVSEALFGTSKTLAQSVAFGPTGTEGGREWVEGGFGNQTAKNTALYRTLTDEYGENQRAAWGFISSLSGKKDQEKRMSVAESGLSDEGKAIAMETIMNSGNSTEGTKFRTAYDNGVSADAWAYFYNTLSEYNTGSNNVTQAEAKEALDNVRIPLSSGEGAAQGLLGGSTETRKLTNKEKAAIWSAYRPDWKPASNPYDANIGEKVSNQYHKMKDEAGKEKGEEE